jgi:hypothetical protein
MLILTLILIYVEHCSKLLTLTHISDLHEEVSYGTMGRAQALYEKIMRHCNTPSSLPAISAAQEKVRRISAFLFQFGILNG